METSGRQASISTSRDEAHEITPLSCCSIYFVTIAIIFAIACPFIFLIFSLNTFSGINKSCYLDLFTSSITITKSANETSDWRISLVAKSPVSGSNISLHTIKSRLLQDLKVISEFSPYNVSFDQTDGSVITLAFKSVPMKPGVIGGVVWDFGVEVVARVRTNVGDAFLLVTCGDIPVNFTVDSVGSVVNGSLLGNIRRCDYSYRYNLDFSY